MPGAVVISGLLRESVVQSTVMKYEQERMDFVDGWAESISLTDTGIELESLRRTFLYSCSSVSIPLLFNKVTSCLT